MTFICAEIGINHNGSVEIAKKLIEAAKWAGADAVKFQKRTVTTVYAGQLDQPRESPWGTTLGAQKYGLEFSRHQYDQIDSFCQNIKMPWFASAWDEESLHFLREYDLPWHKIASAMATNIPFVRAVAKEKKPTFLSTAMCTNEDVARAAVEFRNGWAGKLTLMHCIGTYPAAEVDLNLRAMLGLRARFNLPVGYSGHEASVSPSVMAALMGAVAIERHITLDRSMYGSDQAASLEPGGFKTLVDQVRKIPVVLGDGIRRITEAELKVAKKLRYWQWSENSDETPRVAARAGR